MKARKKPVAVEVLMWNGLNLREMQDFVGKSLKCEIYDLAWQVGKGAPKASLKIETLEGDMNVSKGDYVIKGVHGEFYPCKPDIFLETYEIIEE
ncbi:hypothetical protein [Enterococcus casseliflavus]|uniref:hypothetical protein n=1 Tax=Enterococcus casseliflavus TaxID=37734 RepID=UPI00119CA58F|nr:hypothetical protein [Enterococcus casseliflavus]